MTNHQQQLQKELARVEAAIAAQEDLRGVLADEAIEAALIPLRQKIADLQAQLGDQRSVSDTQAGKNIVTGDNNELIEAQTYIKEQ
jgi:hypothetical protein